MILGVHKSTLLERETYVRPYMEKGSETIPSGSTLYEHFFGSGEELRTLTIPTWSEIGEGDDIVHAAMKIVDDV